MELSLINWFLVFFFAVNDGAVECYDSSGGRRGDAIDRANY